MATLSRRSTTFPACYPIDISCPYVQGTSPNRVWYVTEKGKWASRAWNAGERLEYITSILNRQPHSGELHA